MKAGVVFDVTGSGIYLDTSSWINGWNGFPVDHPGFEEGQFWCHNENTEDTKLFLPSHLYFIASKTNTKEVFSALIPWRLGQDVITKTPFLRRTHFNHELENMIIFRSGNLYCLCNPRNQDLSENCSFSIFFFTKKVQIDNTKVVFLLELLVIINES